MRGSEVEQGTGEGFERRWEGTGDIRGIEGHILSIRPITLMSLPQEGRKQVGDGARLGC